MLLWWMRQCGAQGGASHKPPSLVAMGTQRHAATPIPSPLARDVLRALPEVMAALPHDEVEAVLSDLPRMT